MPQIVHDETGYRDIGLMAVLLEEQPLEHLGLLTRLGRPQGRALRQIEEDGVGFRQGIAVGQLQHRDLAVGVDGQKIGGTGLPASTSTGTQSRGSSSQRASNQGL